MRLLVDEGVDIRLIGVLKRLGHNVRRVPSGRSNGAVMRLARREHRVLITRDADFTDVNRYPPIRSPGIVYLAIHPPWLEKLVPPVSHLFSSLAESDLTGKAFILEETGYHTFS